MKQKINLRLGILLIIFLLSIAAWLAYILTSQKNILEIVGPICNPHPQYFSLLDGRAVENMDAERPAIVAVMMDNHPDAYPQFCLGGVGTVVYEAPAEGATTRFMQVMGADNNLLKVGPVRSARPYYLDWLAEYGDDALYMHCGGAPEALTLIKTRKIFDANEFYWGPYYWRDQQRVAPHNLFTNREKWISLLDKYAQTNSSSTWSGWEYYRGVVGEAGEPVKEISIKYYPGYKVTWRYNQDLVYERLINGDYHRSVCGLDADGKDLFAPITAKNILVQFVQMETIDEIGRKEIKTIGAGDAYVLRDGKLFRGQWKKENLADRTRFYDDKNQEIKLAPGSTWAQIAPAGTAVEVTN